MATYKRKFCSTHHAGQPTVVGPAWDAPQPGIDNADRAATSPRMGYLATQDRTYFSALELRHEYLLPGSSCTSRRTPAWFIENLPRFIPSPPSSRRRTRSALAIFTPCNLHPPVPTKRPSDQALQMSDRIFRIFNPGGLMCPLYLISIGDLC